MAQHRTARLGSIVHIQSAHDDRSVLLVKPRDANPFTNRVSVTSPLGRALLNKQENDQISVSAPRRAEKYIIKDILSMPTDGLFIEYGSMA